MIWLVVRMFAVILSRISVMVSRHVIGEIVNDSHISPAVSRNQT